MPRPPWTPDDEVRQLLEDAAEHFSQANALQDRAAEYEALGWEKVRQARERGAPKDEIADRIPRGRMTVFRHLPKKSASD